MELAKQHCMPCSAETEPFKFQEAQKMLDDLPKWCIIKANPLLLHRFLKFKTYQDTTEFVKKVMEINEEEEHYADITFGNKYVMITLHTPEIKGLHNNDFVIAAKISDVDCEEE